MRALIVEDDFRARYMLQKFLDPYFDVHVAVDGREAIQAFKIAWEEDNPYAVICLDIMLPKLDGQQALIEIRSYEEKKGVMGSDGVKVIMTTALKDSRNVLGAFRTGCEAYLVKPFERKKFLGVLKDLQLIN